MSVDVELITDKDRLRPEGSEVERLWADNRKASHLLNWSPVYCGLDGFKSGLEKTINWFLDPENIKQYKSDIYNL